LRGERLRARRRHRRRVRVVIEPRRRRRSRRAPRRRSSWRFLRSATPARSRGVAPGGIGAAAVDANLARGEEKKKIASACRPRKSLAPRGGARISVRSATNSRSSSSRAEKSSVFLSRTRSFGISRFRAHLLRLQE
jgi:hypothetical protein